MSDFITSSEAAQKYECAFSCDRALFLAIGGDRFFITDSRYTTEAKEFVKNAEVIESADLILKAKNIIKKYRSAKLRADPLEMSYADMKTLLAGNAKSKFVLERRFHQKKRMVKSEKEIEKIKISIRELAAGFDRIADFLNKDGDNKSEKELHFHIEEILRDRGEFELSFNPIFAIEANAAKPHALPGGKRLENGDAILLDAGIKYDGYCSDRTRSAVFGGGKAISFGVNQTFKNAERQKIYDTVLSAHDKAIEFARAGAKAKEIDLIARQHIEDAGYGKYFSHSLGHGVGLEIHEEPYINKKSETIIENGMVFSVEPGIYIPGFFGVRVENVVEIYNDRARIL